MVMGLVEIDGSMARCRSEAVEVRLRGPLAWGRRRVTIWCSRGMFGSHVSRKRGEWTCIYASGQCGHAWERKENTCWVCGVSSLHGGMHGLMILFGLNVFWAEGCG